MTLPYDASRQKEHCSPRPDFDAPKRIWYNPTTECVFRSSEHGFTEYVRADLYAKLEVAEAKRAEKVAALEQERDEYQNALGDLTLTVVKDATTIRDLADKRRREWDADAKSAFLNWERGR
jgi:hypothetical protein